MLDRAQEGDPVALGELRKLLDDHPGLLAQTGDLAHQAEQSWLKALGEGNEVFKEAVARQAKALRRELAGPTPAPLERLLTERVVLCWMALHHAELLYAQRPATLTLDQSAHAQERLARFQRMYLAAIRALAQLRRVAVTVARVLEPDGRHVEAARVEGDGRCSGAPARSDRPALYAARPAGPGLRPASGCSAPEQEAAGAVDAGG